MLSFKPFAVLYEYPQFHSYLPEQKSSVVWAEFSKMESGKRK